MTNTEPVATPRTDANITWKFDDAAKPNAFVDADFARQLERELQAERERADRLELALKAIRQPGKSCMPYIYRAEKAEAELAALEVKTWNAAIEAAAEGFELDDGHYYDQVRESILRLKK